ncbi:MAG: response regulator [Candidatus Riflebacteria bacterium]|nr:response regulator [Candidatus Riflebacteria bacterium]
MPSNQGKKAHLLLVDDEELARNLIQEYLSLVAPEIILHQAINGKDALEKIRKCEPQVILSDIIMPEMDGLKLLKEVKKTFPPTKVIFITARNDTEAPIQALKLGAFDYLRKPLVMEEVVHVVKKAFEEWFLQWDLKEKEEALEKNIKELKQIEKNLSIALSREKEVCGMKTRFISVVSHEFRTPLTSIRSSAEMLEDYIGENEKAKKYIFFIQTAVGRLNELIEEILWLNKVEDEKQIFKPIKVKIKDFCEKIIEETKNGFQDRNIEFVCTLDPRQELLLDESLMVKILNNLLANAFKYSSNDAKVSLTVFIDTLQLDNDKLPKEEKNFCFLGNLTLNPESYENRQFLTFVVRDRGIGIPEAEIKRIFEPFFRGGNVGTIKGTGLGLAIVKKAVEKHGGLILLRSVPKAGSEFTILIPLE